MTLSFPQCDPSYMIFESLNVYSFNFLSRDQLTFHPQMHRYGAAVIGTRGNIRTRVYYNDLQDNHT